MLFRLATSQFPISADIKANYKYIVAQMHAAKAKNCNIIHFPEASLSGYAGVDFKDFEGYNWALLRQCTQDILHLAAELQLWVILGSAHPLSSGHKPHNCLYIINDKGQIQDRYDKRFCAGNATSTEGDLLHYTSGNHFAIFELNGMKCSTLICHDYRYPELYRELKQAGVQLVFHSYHAGNMDATRQVFMESQIGEENFAFNPGRTYPEITMPATMISYAANNYVWISCSNTSAAESCWASFMVRPDGVIIGKLEKNKTDLLITEIDTTKAFYDSTQYWRERSINGELYSGKLVEDPRSEDKTSL